MPLQGLNKRMSHLHDMALGSEFNLLSTFMLNVYKDGGTHRRHPAHSSHVLNVTTTTALLGLVLQGSPVIRVSSSFILDVRALPTKNPYRESVSNFRGPVLLVVYLHRRLSC